MSYHYRIVRSGRKTLALQILAGGEIVAKAPYSATDSRIEAFVKKNEGWIAKHLPLAMARARFVPDEEEIARLWQCAREVLPALTAAYAEKMQLSYRSVRITAAQKRLGSCNSKGGICYSYRLMKYPQDVIEYVVVHELSHLVELNHSERFYAIVSRVLPDYRERVARMNGGIPFDE